MLGRYAIRQDAKVWTLFDQWIREPVALTTLLQVGLTRQDAAELAAMLNRRTPVLPPKPLRMPLMVSQRPSATIPRRITGFPAGRDSIRCLYNRVEA